MVLLLTLQRNMEKPRSLIKNTLLSYYKNEVFPAVEQEGKVYFRTWHDFAMMVSKVRFFEGKEKSAWL